MRHLGLNPVLGYLGAGALLGPLGLGTFSTAVPALFWFTVTDPNNIASIAELGIVFLLFLIGIELSFERLRTMRRLVFGLGSLQVAISAAVLAWIGRRLGLSFGAASVLGLALALSSTAIVIEILASQQRLQSSAGRASFSVLLAQDLAVIPILLFVTILGSGPDGSVLASLGQALLKALIAVGIIVLLGRTLLRPLFRLVASVGSAELFIAATLFVIIGTGLLASVSGLSMALGAFVAGLLLAETEYRKAIESEIEPFKGLLLGVFFFTVGMKIDVRELFREPVLLVACVAGLIVIKAAILTALGRLFRLSWAPALETGLLLGPGGEFAFVAIGLAASLGILGPGVASFWLAVTSLSMALIPPLAVLARWTTGRATRKPVDAEALVKPETAKGHAIVIGYGRVGTVVADLLERHNFPHLVVETDIDAVVQERKRGHSVYYGDATDSAFLHACGIADASAVIVTIHTRTAIDTIVDLVRRLRPDIPIVSRARDAAHARHLYAIGVTDAVPETIEASLQLSEAALVGLGLQTGPVIAAIHERRDEFRRDLQQAAGAAGLPTSRAIRTRPATG